MARPAYAFARWKRARVAPDYYVEMDSSWYSVPFGLIREEMGIRISGDIVEIFHKGQRVAATCHGLTRPSYPQGRRRWVLGRAKQACPRGAAPQHPSPS